MLRVNTTPIFPFCYLPFYFYANYTMLHTFSTLNINTIILYYLYNIQLLDSFFQKGKPLIF